MIKLRTSLLFLCLPAWVHGATVSYTALASLSGGNGTGTTPVSLQQFDPALGTLTGVTFNVADTTVITLAYENASNPAGTYGSSETVTTNLDDGATTLATEVTTATRSSVLTTFDGVVDFAGASEATFSGTFSGAGSGAGSLTAYLGVGSTIFDLNRVAIQTGVGMPFVINNAATSSYTASVTYTYTPVPEPGFGGPARCRFGNGWFAQSSENRLISRRAFTRPLYYKSPSRSVCEGLLYAISRTSSRPAKKLGTEGAGDQRKRGKTNLHGNQRLSVWS